MRLVIQRVKHCCVTVNGTLAGQIGQGFLVLVGFGGHDTKTECELLAEKLVHLRVFADSDGRMNRSLLDTGGEALLVSQFTLYADCRKGRRPSFAAAAPPQQATELYEYFCETVAAKNVPIATGVFGAHMEIVLLNDGPVTLLLEANSGVVC